MDEMKQLTLFDLSQYRYKWIALYEPHVMDKLANIASMNWRDRLKEMNNPHLMTIPDKRMKEEG